MTDGTSGAVRRLLSHSTAFLIVLVTIIIVVSPLFLLAILSSFRLDWPLISAVGQSYSAASAILSGLALVAATLAVRLQVRQSYVAQEQGLRATQFEMLKLALGDDDLLAASSLIVPESATSAERRQHVYLTLGLRHYQMLALFQSMNADQARDMLLTEFFLARQTLSYWDRVRSVWETGALTKPERTFLRGVEMAYEVTRSRQADDPDHDDLPGT